MVTLLPLSVSAAEWLHFLPKEGTASGKTIVFETGDDLPKKSDVTPVPQPNPLKRGVKPQEVLEQGLAKLAAKESTIIFYGNSMIERFLEHGELEARLQIAMPEAKLKIRSLAWTGDEVGNRLRLEGYAKHMKKLLAEWPANTIVLGYGPFASG